MGKNKTDSYILKESDRKSKKWEIITPKGKSIHFGGKGYSDFTIHKDLERKESYIARHKKNDQNWKKSGINSAGFWSRWLLWNKPGIRLSIHDIEKRFSIKIIKRRD